MIRLFLLRHAKAVISAPGGSDFDRGLTPGGSQAAAAMGRFMAENGLIPDHILCSSAKRTRQTLEAVRGECAMNAEPVFSREAYSLGAGTYLPLLRQMPETCGTLLLVGHNPVIQQTARRLSGEGERAQLGLLSLNFPTSALAVIEFEGITWAELGEADGRLVTFARISAGHVVTSAAERDDED